MTLLLLRHGETLLNAARVMQPADTPLGPRGLAQAASAARRLAGLQPAAILSSDLPRAWQTAQAVAAATGLAVEASPLLHERNFGELRGRLRDDLGFDPLELMEAPAGGESMPAFLDRAARAWAWVLQRRARLDGPLVVVTHGLVLHAWLSRQVQIAPGLALPERLANTALSIVDAGPPARATLIGCTVHLTADATDDPSALFGG